jgi:hypothetical protein
VLKFVYIKQNSEKIIEGQIYFRDLNYICGEKGSAANITYFLSRTGLG